MRVTLCVDALEPQPGGIGRYTWELCKGLATNSDVEFLHFFGRGRLIDDPALLIEGARLPRQRRLFRRFHDWQMSRTLKTSLVHGPNYFLPAGADRGIITVHDLSVFRFPETHPVERVKAFERLFASSMRRAMHVITDTETVRRELMDRFSVRPEMVTSVPLGVSSQFAPARADGPELRSIGLVQGAYGLCVSALEPRKKILELLSAWRELPKELRAKFPLVLAGGSGWENEALHDEIELGVAEGWLCHLGFVEELKLPALYAGAALFVYPSSYEGFGLPPLEAMASGTPVIVADRSCLPEVCGDAAHYVDPDDEFAFIETLRSALEDEGWRRRASLRGLERAKLFSWSRCVDETLSVYRDVINSV